MTSGVSEGIRFLNASEPHSPEDDTVLSGSPGNRRSSSPGYDSNPEKSVSRKRTNTTSSNGDKSEKRTAKKVRKKGKKICRVCGDKAFSYNFNVITCESCKAFFRRNANKEKDIRCPFNEQCEINVVSRRFCQRCRLAKCFEVGMKKEWIMSEEARMEKKQRVEENRERRLQDAMRAEFPNVEESPSRERLKSESRSDDSVQTPTAPAQTAPPPLTVREVDLPQPSAPTAATIPISLSPPVVSMAPPPMAMVPPPAVAIPHPMDVGAVVFGVNTCASHHMLDSIPTTAAHSLADVSSTTSNHQAMDVDPASTMSGVGFIPPNPNDSAPQTISSILPVNMASSVESSIMAAQAQLAAQHVQAAINHQQQLAAAVAAAAQIGVVPSPSLTSGLPSTLPTPIPQSILAPQLSSSAPAPVTPAVLHALTSAKPLSGSSDMVTIPREVLFKLIENNQQRAVNCKCTCVCGRYPPGSVIVDEVTKDLIAAGGQQNSNDREEERKPESRSIETNEAGGLDLHMNGLLPSEDSKIQWLNSSQPNVVDPSNFSDPNVGGTSIPMDPFFPNLTVLETQKQSSTAVTPAPQTQPQPMVISSSTDPDLHVLTVSDRDILKEVEAANNEWGENELSDKYHRYIQLRSDTSGGCLQLAMDTTVRELMRASRRLACFRALQRTDQLSIIKERCLAYLIMRGAQLFDLRTNQWRGSESWPSSMETQMQCARLYSRLSDEIRASDSIMAVLALLCLFDPDVPVASREDISREHGKLIGLLKRLLFVQYGENESRARDEFINLSSLLPLARELSILCGPAFSYDPIRTEVILSGEAPPIS